MLTRTKSFALAPSWEGDLGGIPPGEGGQTNGEGYQSRVGEREGQVEGGGGRRGKGSSLEGIILMGRKWGTAMMRGNEKKSSGRAV